MHNYVVFSAARTGSSYIAGAIAKQIGCLEPNVFYGGELLRWDEYFQLSPPAQPGPGKLLMLEHDPTQLYEYDQTRPQGVGIHFFMGDQGRLMRVTRETGWEERAPVSFRRAWEESQRRLSTLENSYYPWVIKVHPEHLQCLDMYRFNEMIGRETTKVVILYRSFLWDWFLSWVALRKTGVFNHRQRDGDWAKPEIEATEVTKDFLRTWYMNAREFLNMVLTYRRMADHIVSYESFSGDPRTDAGRITGIDLFPDTPHQVKLWSTEEKEKMLSNLDEVKELFKAYCKLLGYASGTMYL